MKCHNCDKLAMWLVGKPAKIPLCLDCYGKLVAIQDQERAGLERHLNYIAGEIEASVGMPGFIPRIPPRPPRTLVQGTTVLNHINVSNSNVGVLNTGSIGSIDSAIGIMIAEGSDAAAGAFKDLTEAITQCDDIPMSDKKRAVELISLIAAEGALPKEKRRSFAIKPLLLDLSSLLSGAVSMCELWSRVGPSITGLFT